MKALITMLERKIPGGSKSHYFRSNWERWQMALKAFEKLESRRPEKFEEALTALVNWIAKKIEEDEFDNIANAQQAEIRSQARRWYE